MVVFLVSISINRHAKDMSLLYLFAFRRLFAWLFCSNTNSSVLLVILSDYYDLPFNDALDWRKFAVVLRERDVYQIKSILKSISQEEFVSLHKSLVQVCLFWTLANSYCILCIHCPPAKEYLEFQILNLTVIEKRYIGWQDSKSFISRKLATLKFIFVKSELFDLLVLGWCSESFWDN